MNFSIIIDPQILFLPTCNGTVKHHPILSAWLHVMRMKKIDYFYWLNRTPPEMVFFVEANKRKFPIPLKIFNSIMEDGTRAFVKSLWGKRYKVASLNHASMKGVLFSDKRMPQAMEMLVITADDKIAQYFRAREISVVNMRAIQPWVDVEKMKQVINKEVTEVFCDFDGTLNYTDKVRFLSVILKKFNLSFNQKKLGKSFFIQQKTVELLEEYSSCPITIITQRSAEFEPKHLPCGQIKNVIAQINRRSKTLKINMSLFLNGVALCAQGRQYPKKAEIIFDLMQAKRIGGGVLPTNLLLLDDHPEEISSAVEMREKFKKLLDINLIMIFVPDLLVVLDPPQLFDWGNLDITYKRMQKRIFTIYFNFLKFLLRYDRPEQKEALCVYRKNAPAELQQSVCSSVSRISLAPSEHILWRFWSEHARQRSRARPGSEEESKHETKALLAPSSQFRHF